MTELPLDGLLSVEDVARFMSVSTKTVRRMMSRGELVTHRLGRSVRVDASSVTSLLAGSVTSTAVETVAMNDKKNDSGPGAPRLYRQRGKSKVWTCLVNNQEVPLGTNDEKEARRRVMAIVAEPAPTVRRPYRACRLGTGYAVMFYDEAGKRRLHRVPPDAGVLDLPQAEAYAEVWYRQTVAQALPQGTSRGSRPIDTGITFEVFARKWTSGELAESFPDHVKPKVTAKNDLQRLQLYVFPVIGAEPMPSFEGRRGLDLVEKVQAALPPVSSTFTRGSRRQVLQAIHRILVLAAYPARLIPASPLPKGFLPKVGQHKSKSYVYPDEDARLMTCAAVPLVLRLCYGILIREGFRVSELLGLAWSKVDLVHGTVVLDENKTDDPRSWVLDPGVVEALRRWKATFAWRPGPTVRILRPKDEFRLDRYELAAGLREALVTAGVTRPQLFERSEHRLPLRAHDLRASFVTVNLALGRSEAWITDRTGHRSSQMIYRYKRAARTHSELSLGGFVPLHEAIPELREVAPVG